MSISEEEVACLHKANRPSVQVHLGTGTAKLIIDSFVRVDEFINSTVKWTPIGWTGR